MKARRRTFNRRERRAIYRRACGQCERCGVELTYRNFHADHMVPFSRGGETAIDNGQALCSGCNLSKGTTVSIRELMHRVKLRDFQQRLFEAWRREVMKRKNTKDFAAFIATGGGKTKGATYIAADMLANGEIDGVLVCVSSTSTIGALRKQGKPGYGWLGAMQEVGITSIIGENGKLEFGLPRDVQSIVMHYSSVVNGVEHLAELMRGRRWLLILDEPQHLAVSEEEDEESDDDFIADDGPDYAATDKAWGAAVEKLLQIRTYSLLLTATPIRTDRERVPGMQYEWDGRQWVVTAHFQYSFQEAHKDGLVREVMFHWLDAQSTWIENGDMMTAVFSDEGVSKKGRTAQMKAFLDPKSDAFKEMVTKAIDNLIEKRVAEAAAGLTPSAAMMIVAMNVQHARLIEQTFRAEFQARLNAKATVVVSEDPAAHRSLTAFRDGTEPVLISVGMVAEGTDVPRLRTLVFATNKLTRLHFIQVVGRTVRVIFVDGERTPTVQGADVFMPAHARLIEYSMEFRDLHMTMKPKLDIPGPEPKKGESALPVNSVPTEMGGTVGSLAERLTPAGYAYIASFKAANGLTAPDDEVYKMLKAVGKWPSHFDEPVVQRKKTESTDSLTDLSHAELRSLIQKAQQGAARRQYPYDEPGVANAKVRADANRKVGITGRLDLETATKEQLIALLNVMQAMSSPFSEVV